MLRIPFILSILAAVMLLVACPPVNPPTFCEANPDAEECQPDSCKPNCIAPEIKFTSTISQNPKPVFQGGDTIEGNFTIQAVDPDETIDVAVIFLNLVHACPVGQQCTPPQGGGDLFASEKDVTVTNKIFNKVLTGEQLRAGLNTSFSGKLKGNAVADEYSMFIQVYQCRNTDPNKVGEDPNCNPRLGGRGYRFFVE